MDKEAHTLVINASVNDLIAAGNAMYADYE
jgi:hypothetical protein